MFRNLTKYSISSFRKQWPYVIIKVLGLSIGLAGSLLIALYVINEASHDRFNVKKDRIFRLVLMAKSRDQEIHTSYSCAPIGPTLFREFPEIEDFLRMHGLGPTVIKFKDQTLTDENIIAVDSSFFNFFSIPLIMGDPVNVLNTPGKAVITESMAKKIFGKEDPVGKAISLGEDTSRYIISGIMSDTPKASHFDAHMLVSFMTFPGANSTVWLNNNYSTYLLLRSNTNYTTVADKIPSILEKYVGPELMQAMGLSIQDFMKQGNAYNFSLQKLTDIHLDPSILQEFKPAADPSYLYIFISISILVIIIASINFMNLATAQASRRAKEVGIKKVGGCSRKTLICQFMTESILVSFFSLILSVILIRITLPYFNNLLGTQLELNLLARWDTIPYLLVFTIIVGIISGSYPAFYLSSFNPVDILRGSVKGSVRNVTLRRILVVFQFAVSILLLTATIVMYRQIYYMLNKNMGFNKEQMLVINRVQSLESRVEPFKDAAKKIPGVINITSSTAVPFHNTSTGGFGIEGRKEEIFMMTANWIDFDFIDTYKMTFVNGRNFDRNYTTDINACIINESAARNLKITDFENTRIIQPAPGNEQRYLQVIGIVKDFNFESLRYPIQPYIFLCKGNEDLSGYVTIKISAQNYQKTINAINDHWKEFSSDAPMQYYFIDEDFEQVYKQEKQNAQLSVMFSILAILIALLGLFGLTSYTVEQSTKEIGVRKVMGSSVSEIYFVISKEIIILIIISALIAWPLVYYISTRWLENFYFRIHPGVVSFLSGLIIVLGIALATISYHIFKAARVNPAESLKYE